MKIVIPSPLLSYTRTREVEACGRTLREVFADLDRRYPGIRFRLIDEQERIRPHMRVFVNGEQELDLGRAVRDADAVQVIQALSGG